MKTLRSVVFPILLLLSVCALLSSCSFFDFFSVDSLIRPPKLTGENALIEQTFETAVGTDVMLISPVSGKHRSAFIQYDLDRDGTEETLVFYAKTNAPNEAHLHFLKYDGFRWYSAGDVTGNGSEVYAVDFYNLDQSVGMEIAVTWTVSDSRRNKTLSLYRFLGKDGFPDIVQLSVLQIYDYMVSDFDSDGQPELLYLMDNSSDQGQPFKASMIKMGIDDSVMHFICELQLRPSINLPLKMSYDILNGSYRLYIDCVNYDGTYMTEVLYYDKTAAILARIQDESGAELTDQTIRSAEVYCGDVNNDRLVEIPVEINMEEFSVLGQNAGESVALPLIRFMKCDNAKLAKTNYTYFYAPDHTFRFRLDDFTGDYTGTYDAASGEFRFYAKEIPDEPVFTVTFSASPNGSGQVNVLIAEPEISQITESYVRKYVEIL